MIRLTGDRQLDPFIRRLNRKKIREPGPGQHVAECHFSKTGWAICNDDGGCTCEPARKPPSNRSAQEGEESTFRSPLEIYAAGNDRDDRRVVLIDYMNHRGERRWRRVMPDPDLPFMWGATEYHPVEQWFLCARDLEKDAPRLFAMCAIREWRSTWP
jgi:hypothetical protein